jgi:hypothetical protein
VLARGAGRHEVLKLPVPAAVPVLARKEA